jgi:hypothetical protein
VEHEDRGLVVVASFTGMDEAVVARGMLQAQGIETFARNEHLVSIAWQLSQATGGVSLAVPAKDAERARELLGSRAMSTPEKESGPDGEDVAAGPGDALAEQAWKSALLGFFLLPPLLHLWSLWLLHKAYAAGGPRTDHGRSSARRAVVVSSCVVMAAAAILVKVLNP